MPLDQKCLLLYLFNKVIENDLINDSSGYKGLWAGKWRIQVDTFLWAKMKSVENLNVLKNLNDTFTNIIDNLDLLVLYNEIAKQKSNVVKSWELDLYRQCEVFSPYDWLDLLLKKRREKSGMGSYIKSSKPYALN